MEERLTLRQASAWASDTYGRDITPHNISYLVQYGLISRIGNKHGTSLVSREDLQAYYGSLREREISWREELGEDLNWHLSFDRLKEKETTKHVHRLHPYKGKFIPQLVEYFLDAHTDSYKKARFFKADDIVLDPFCGSGTTLVQAAEMGIHAIGIDVSCFNTFMTNNKLSRVCISELRKAVIGITSRLQQHQIGVRIHTFQNALKKEIGDFNARFFPAPTFKQQVRSGMVDEPSWGREKEEAFLPRYRQLLRDYRIDVGAGGDHTFLGKWYMPTILQQIRFLSSEIEREKPVVRDMLRLILSRTVRTCRATTHADLGTLKDPQFTPYYCKKHAKMCRPLFLLDGWWYRYCLDTVDRLQAFAEVRKVGKQLCVSGDARSIGLTEEIGRHDVGLSSLVASQKIRGVFSSPPYLGVIDYHEQHAYAYELFGFPRLDKSEIGGLCNGTGKAAQEQYVAGISQVLLNSKRHLQAGYDVFLVANDKYDLYPLIAQRSGMQIIHRYKRPVLNRTEKTRSKPYCEIIFHLREAS